ncbi:Uma2 family endonuclease [Pendulispora brunnea]|uniref:Uma2 family endonuclease n=1 Tax=Pendulispora brunnea TaxID=2905690 RepID=A0ABZ2K2V5_9BACT
MAAIAQHKYSFEDYLQVEEMSPNIKHEFLAGTIRAMAGGTVAHGRISVNVSTLLNMQLRGKPCAVHSSDVRIRVRKSGVATYPDVSVICGRIELDPEDRTSTTATNPKVLVEVLSPSTELYDRTDKLENYKQIESVQEVVFVAHDTRRIEVVRRVGDSWKHFEYVEGEAELASVQCTLPLAEVYRDPTA